MPTKDLNRKAVHGWVALDSHDGWHDFAGEQGCTVSALLDMVGAELAKLRRQPGPVPQPWANWIVEARKIDALNRRRTR